MSGSLTHSPADILRQLLVDLSQATAPAAGGSWPAYVGQEPDSPDNVLTLYDTTGKKGGRDQNSGRVYEHYGVQLRIRAVSHLVGYTKAQALGVFLDESVRLQTVTISASSYMVYAVSRAGSVMALGKNMPISKHDLFTINVLVALRAL